jgi:hypothetical protein
MRRGGVLTPRIASACISIQRVMAHLALDNLARALTQRRPVTPLSPGVRRRTTPIACRWREREFARED